MFLKYHVFFASVNSTSSTSSHSITFDQQQQQQKHICRHENTALLSSFIIPWQFSYIDFESIDANMLLRLDCFRMHLVRNHSQLPLNWKCSSTIAKPHQNKNIVNNTNNTFHSYSRAPFGRLTHGFIFPPISSTA